MFVFESEVIDTPRNVVDRLVVDRVKVGKAYFSVFHVDVKIKRVIVEIIISRNHITQIIIGNT